MIRAITIEREFGCGASEIAGLVASSLGWDLWDERLTREIARLTESTPQAVERREWRSDPAAYRFLKSFLRGAFEGGLPPISRLRMLDARRIADASGTAVKAALSGGPCVIVGRGAQYFLRARADVFHVFLYGPRDMKISRLIAGGVAEKRAIEQIDTTDRARAAFVRQYLGLKWPDRHLYHAMFNTEAGDSATAAMLIQCLKLFDRKGGDVSVVGGVSAMGLSRPDGSGLSGA